MATLVEKNHDSDTVLTNNYNNVNNPDGAMSIIAGAALDGSTYGVQMDFDAGISIANRIREDNFHTSDVTEFYWRFRMDLGGVTNNNSGYEFMATDIIGNLGILISEVTVTANAGDSGFTADLAYWKDGAGLTVIGTASFPSSGDTIAEIQIVRETADGNNDGVVQLSINGSVVIQETAAENFNSFQSNYSLNANFRSNNVNLTGTLKYDQVIVNDDAGLGGLSLAAMTKPADIDMAGTFIYLALLEGGTPILTKIATDLLSDGSTVFNPGSGDNIGVQCGKFDSDIIWVAGNFGGTDTVEKSEDAGSSFVVKDPATFDPVTSFVVGPDSDDRVLLFADAGGSVASSSIQETIDSGASWSQKDSALGFVSRAVERLDINVEEIVTGNEAGASDNIHYSPNTGQDLEDYSTGFPTQDVAKLIVS